MAAAIAATSASATNSKEALYDKYSNARSLRPGYFRVGRVTTNRHQFSHEISLHSFLIGAMAYLPIQLFALGSPV